MTLVFFCPTREALTCISASCNAPLFSAVPGIRAFALDVIRLPREVMCSASVSDARDADARRAHAVKTRAGLCVDPGSIGSRLCVQSRVMHPTLPQAAFKTTSTAPGEHDCARTDSAHIDPLSRGATNFRSHAVPSDIRAQACPLAAGRTKSRRSFQQQVPHE